jgi:adenylate cyclase
MEQDEVGTLRTLTAYREIMDRLIAEHGGRIANTAGDSMLAEFPSAVDAVQCAIEVQAALASIDQDRPEEARLRFRIGVHVGDVMVRGSDLLGDGVNIAARLESIAAPGSVCISAATHDYVRRVLPLAYTDLGPQQVKNIDEPIRTFAVTLASTGSTTTPRPAPQPLPDKPSIAVLPFTNMSGDPEQEYFADGITEDLITALSRFRWLFVIARNSTFTLKGRAVDIKDVSRQLGVRYVLEGSVRKAGRRVRVSAQLVEAATSTEMWAGRFDRDLTDIFAMQDEITESVVSAIEPSLQAAEIARAKAKTSNLEAYDLYLRALPEFYAYTEQGFRRAEALLLQAVERDPGYADAWGALADCIGRLMVGGWTNDWNAGAAQNREAALRAVQCDPENGLTLGRPGSSRHLLRARPLPSPELVERPDKLRVGADLQR